MERKGLIFAFLVSALLFGQIQPDGKLGEDKGVFEIGTLMSIEKNSVVIDESTFLLDQNAQVTDALGNPVPLMFIKLPALCKFQTNLMKGEESDTVKIIKLIILRPIRQTEFQKIMRKKE